MKRSDIRNVAIIAHVDHGKTTLVDQMLRQSGMFRAEYLEKLAGGEYGLIMDSNPIERERGITILSKNCAITYHSPESGVTKINIIDTPGHADFGGEVERVLKMADGCLLLVDAFEGPMPQTRFVLKKAFECGLRPIVVVNKIDRPDARPQEVVNETFDLFVELGADDGALDFPIVYASGREGYAGADPQHLENTIQPLFETILRHVPVADADAAAPLQLLVTTLDYSDYVGRIAIGRVFAGTLRNGQRVTLIKRDGSHVPGTVDQLLQFDGLGRTETDAVTAGDICAIVGLDDVDISDTVCDAETPVALPSIQVDEPTLHMMFCVNDSPFAGRDGKYVTSRQLRERLWKELKSNVALRVDFDTGSMDEFLVSGRGLLHLSILIENMRREGFELAAGKPEVILKHENGKTREPIEFLVVDVPIAYLGAVMELTGNRRGECTRMDTRGESVHLEFTIPARGLIGLRNRIMTVCSGQVVMHHNFHGYEPMRGPIAGRSVGVMISTESGAATGYAMDNLQQRGSLFVSPGDPVYEGQIVGEHCRENDLPVNVCREKKLTNMRAAGSDKNILLKPPRELTLEIALEYIADDELVEVTPNALRLRKRLLTETGRKRAQRRAE
jgi:GTP-binding protein